MANRAVWLRDRADRHPENPNVAAMRLEADMLEAELVARQRCKRCGRPLSDPVSMKQGVGPDCLRQLR
jgi:hypothetical protein